MASFIKFKAIVVIVFAKSLLWGAFVFAQASSIIDFDDQRLSYEGRIDFGDSYAEFDWPCTAIRGQVIGQGTLYATLDGGGNHFLLNTDGHERIVKLGKGRQRLEIAYFTQPGSHAFSLKKITEASYFAVSFLMNQRPVKMFSLELVGDLQLVDPPRAQRRLEFFGDSSLNGFGVEKPRGSIFATLGNFIGLENCAKTYGSKLARAFEADIHMQAWSGKGLLANAIKVSRHSSAALPIYWDRTLATSAKKPWDFGKWLPDAVIVQLGGNDFYMPPYPHGEDFKEAYRKLLATIRSAYAPHKPAIIGVCGQDDIHLRSNCPLIASVHRELAADDPRLHYVEVKAELFDEADWGSLKHLAESGHHKIAELLTPLLAEIFG